MDKSIEARLGLKIFHRMDQDALEQKGVVLAPTPSNRLYYLI